MDLLFTPTELLVVADTVVKSHTEDDKEERSLNILSDLAILSLNQGLYLAREKMKAGEYPDDIQGLKAAFAEGEKRWISIVEYINANTDERINQLGYDMILLYLISDGKEGDLTEAAKSYIEDIIEASSKESKNVDVEIVSVPDIESFGGDPKELVQAYFVMLGELGTFHRDRSKYNTEHEKSLHDKIVAIYNKVGNIDRLKL